MGSEKLSARALCTFRMTSGLMSVLKPDIDTWDVVVSGRKNRKVIDAGTIRFGGVNDACGVIGDVDLRAHNKSASGIGYAAAERGVCRLRICRNVERQNP